MILPELKALEILETYEGTNNQILYWKHRMLIENASISKSQADYIIKYHSIPPKTAKKFIKIESYYAQKLQEERTMNAPPENIWIEKLLAESDKAYHVMGKIEDKLEFMWLPKCFIIKEDKCSVEVDYSKYAERPPLSHQPEAIEKLICNDKFILADDMGLCKTGSAVIASIEVKAKKILIICPATLKINWKREIEMFTDEPVYIVDGKKWEDGHTYYIINYDILKNFHEIVKPNEETTKVELSNTNFDLLIIDEAHFLSNNKSDRSQLVNDIARKIKKIWLLTGTPMTSRPINYYNLLQLIDSPIAYNWQTYVRRYCKGYQFKIGKKRIWNVSGASNLEELRERTKPYILRRLKTEVLDLPEKIITPVHLDLKAKSYEDEMGEYLEWSDKEGKDEPISVQLAQLMKIRMLIAEEKVPYTCEIVDRILEQEKKVIVFTNFTNVLNRFVEYYGKKCVSLDGRMTKAARQLSVDKFQENDKITVFVANLRAGGVGITLTAAEAEVMNDLSFVPSDHAQAEDRSFRYGQKKSVSIYYPLFQNTLEMQIYNILERKKNIIETVMGDGEFTNGFGMDFLKNLKKK